MDIEARQTPCELAARAGPVPTIVPQDSLQAAMLARVLDEIDHGLLVVDLTGHFIHVNHPAHRELSAARALYYADGMLKSSDPHADASIRQALRDAARDCRTIVEASHPTDPLMLAFIPLSPWPGGKVDAVLVMCSRRESCAKLTLQMFARSKQLTKAEQSVLEQLCAGHAARDIAQLQGLCVSTVRTHIKSVRQKTGARSVREVVRRIACMPQVAHALRVAAHH